MISAPSATPGSVPPARDAAPSRPFLTATWANLILLNFEVPRGLLLPRLPPGLELDLRAGCAFASLVAFNFLDTRVRGIRFPGLADFPEINLRFYVRAGEQRGVVFIREFVPSRIVSLVARAVYNEPYRALPMRCDLRPYADGLEIEHTFGRRAEHSILADARLPSEPPLRGGTQQWFKEHEWGFGVSRSGRTLRYRVAHPEWRVLPTRNCRYVIDFADLYGAEWGFLSDARPISQFIAEGSPVAVYPGAPLAGASVP